MSDLPPGLCVMGFGGQVGFSGWGAALPVNATTGPLCRKEKVL